MGRTTKVKKTETAPVVTPEPEATPLMTTGTGHYEQPMSLVPVSTTTPSYTAAPTYMPTVVETVAPTYMPTVAPIATTASYMPMAAQSVVEYMPTAVAPV